MILRNLLMSGVMFSLTAAPAFAGNLYDYSEFGQFNKYDKQYKSGNTDSFVYIELDGDVLLQGVVLSATSSLLRVSSFGGTWNVAVNGGARLIDKKGRSVGIGDIELGDRILVDGVMNPRTALSMNISAETVLLKTSDRRQAEISGTILSIGSTSFTMFTAQQGTITVNVTPDTEILLETKKGKGKGYNKSYNKGYSKKNYGKVNYGSEGRYSDLKKGMSVVVTGSYNNRTKVLTADCIFAEKLIRTFYLDDDCDRDCDEHKDYYKDFKFKKVKNYDDCEFDCFDNGYDKKKHKGYDGYGYGKDYDDYGYGSKGKKKSYDYDYDYGYGSYPW